MNSSVREIISAALIVVFAIPLSVHDLRSRRLPNRLVGAFSLVVALFVAGVGVGGAATLMASAVGWAIAVGAAAVGFSLLLPKALGMGDAKLLPALTALVVVCSTSAAASLLLACWLASVAGCVAAVWSRVRQGVWPQSVAYGPHLLGSTLAVCLLPM